MSLIIKTEIIDPEKHENVVYVSPSNIKIEIKQENEEILTQKNKQVEKYQSEKSNICENSHLDDKETFDNKFSEQNAEKLNSEYPNVHVNIEENR